MRCTTEITAFKTPDGQLYEHETDAIDMMLEECEKKCMKNILRESVRFSDAGGVSYDIFQTLRDLFREFDVEYNKLRKLRSEAGSRAEPPDDRYI